MRMHFSYAFHLPSLLLSLSQYNLLSDKQTNKRTITFDITMDNDYQRHIDYSMNLSQSFWSSYNAHINTFGDFGRQKCNLQVQENSKLNEITPLFAISDTDKAYEEFIKKTRAHQESVRRDKLKRKRKLGGDEDYNYVDISQINTLVQDNLARVPNKHDDNDSYTYNLIWNDSEKEKIRGMEIAIDDDFNRMIKQLKPHFWPAIPINLKPYCK